MPDGSANVLAALRAAAPAVHCLTNRAADVFTADCLLALGARPTLTANPRDVGDFVRAASALLVNLGTLENEREAAIGPAIEAGWPWVLDPAHAEASPRRLALAEELLTQRPAIVRLNARELSALDATAIRASGAVVLLSGAEDCIFYGARECRIAGGSALMDRGTAYGCALGAVAAACLVASAPFEAACAASAIFALAGAKAERMAAGPGSFRPAFLDALHLLGPEDLADA